MTHVETPRGRQARFRGVVEAFALLAVPVSLVFGAVFEVEQAGLMTLVVAVAAILVFLVGWERSKPALRQVMPTVVLAALAAAGRLLFAPFADVKPVSAVAIVGGAVFGRRSGFMVGALAALISNFFLGQGPWTPWQMYAWGLVGYVAGMLADHDLFRRQWILYCYGFCSGLVYGFVMNTWTVVGFVRPFTWASALGIFAAALPLDIIHSVTTVVFLLLIYSPWRKKLIRIRDKYALGS